MAHVVVIGAGQAGLSCVAKLRNLGFDGQVTLIGEENVPPYQRPPLSKKYLLGEMDIERLYLRPTRFFGDHDIDLRLGEAVVLINRADKTLQTTTQSLDYDHLVFATGSVPRRLPAAIGGTLDAVHNIRDLKDVDKMAPEFIAGRRVLIVGGGYIGLEAAAVAASKGLKVTLVEMADRILQRVAASQTSDYFRDLHRTHGVTLLEGVGLDRLTGTGRVSGALLSDGSVLELDFVITGVGISPATALAEGAGLDIENGIRTSAHGRTSDPYIWAAGDCASFPFRGDRIRLESVPNAIDQAECVAENIMGAEKPYIARPWFWSDQYDIKLQIAGLNNGFDRVVTRANDAVSKSFWYFKGMELLAVDAANAPRDYMVGKRLIDGGKSPDPEALANLEINIKDLMRL
ncbi:NAD(P)/FAD-dependent oxidoreductase [Pseudopelagicola sp. nBUS_19]|uniref:NAD(P)/FAD-dependent oxidoreductase n=1 Tax=Pseudopelagicola sp. nBUS_19 TaxID=3395316 RepID=UPI003EBFC21F